MNVKDIKLLEKILIHKNRADLSALLKGSYGEIVGSGSYGSYAYSDLSTYIIYSPLEEYYKLKSLLKEDVDLIFSSLLDIYPPAEDSPEIIRLEFRLQPDDAAVSADELKTNPDDVIKSTLRVFISYNTIDKQLVGLIKFWLEKFGLEVFTAHDDISPSSEWQSVILQNLDSTDIFIAIITSDFHSSKWTDQESGIAFAKNKLILPVSIEGNHSYGFINKYQDLAFNTNNIAESCFRIVKCIQEKERFNLTLRQSIINSFTNISSYDEAGYKSELLTGFQEFNADQLNKVLNSLFSNDQISSSRSARNHLINLFQKFKHLLSPAMVNQVETLYNIRL